jgi:hypothetical protein
VKVIEQGQYRPFDCTGDLLAVEIPVVAHLQPRRRMDRLQHGGREFAIGFGQFAHRIGHCRSISFDALILVRHANRAPLRRGTQEDGNRSDAIEADIGWADRVDQFGLGAWQGNILAGHFTDPANEPIEHRLAIGEVAIDRAPADAGDCGNDIVVDVDVTRRQHLSHCVDHACARVLPLALAQSVAILGNFGVVMVLRGHVSSIMRHI